ncbi:MAG: hypothetical protein QXN72_03650 [Candidatus Caldarchaeum sp.]
MRRDVESRQRFLESLGLENAGGTWRSLTAALPQRVYKSTPVIRANPSASAEAEKREIRPTDPYTGSGLG